MQHVAIINDKKIFYEMYNSLFLYPRVIEQEPARGFIVRPWSEEFSVEL